MQSQSVLLSIVHAVGILWSRQPFRSFDMLFCWVGCKGNRRDCAVDRRKISFHQSADHRIYAFNAKRTILWHAKLNKLALNRLKLSFNVFFDGRLPKKSFFSSSLEQMQFPVLFCDIFLFVEMLKIHKFQILFGAFVKTNRNKWKWKWSKCNFCLV